MKCPETNTHRNALYVAGLSAIALLASGCSTEASPPAAQKCVPYTLFAQNRYPVTPYTDTYGAAVRRDHSKTEPLVGTYAGNAPIKVDGWVHTQVQTYPQNRFPFNNDIWFRLVNGGWVSFAGTRNALTTRDPSGQDTNGGEPSVHKPECEIPILPLIPTAKK